MISTDNGTFVFILLPVFNGFKVETDVGPLLDLMQALFQFGFSEFFSGITF